MDLGLISVKSEGSFAKSTRARGRPRGPPVAVPPRAVGPRLLGRVGREEGNGFFLLFDFRNSFSN